MNILRLICILGPVGQVMSCSGVMAEQTGILRLRVIEGEGSVQVAGTRTARPLTVEVTDEMGRPLAGAAVSFMLPVEGPGGLFSNGLRTDLVLTDSSGKAAIRNVHLNRIAGPYQIRVTAVKDQARAGIVSNQYISGIGSGSPSAKEVGKSRRKWLAIALLAAGVAAGGTAAGFAVSSPNPSPSVVPPPPSVGTPTFTVGRP